MKPIAKDKILTFILNYLMCIKFHRNISRKMSGVGIKVVTKIKYALDGVIKKGKDKVDKNA